MKIIHCPISDMSLVMAALVDGASEPEELINADRDIIRYYDRLGDGVWDIFNAGLGVCCGWVCRRNF
jgi:hypothetical protein